jgi:ubiquinone/menaquinone biosynthesis C-methylase UbiE
MDQDAGPPQEIARALRDLRRINRWFGGIRTTLKMLERVAGSTQRRRLSMLDVGAASGDVALAARRALAHKHIELEITLADRRPAHLHFSSPSNYAGKRTVGAASGPDQSPVRCVAADALALPFAAESFDVVTCGLLAHHLEPEQLIAFVSQAVRVCRIAVLINDLQRSALSLALVYAGFPLFCRMVRHDGMASVKRAYTVEEMRQMLHQAGGPRVEVARSYLFRMEAIVWKY